MGLLVEEVIEDEVTPFIQNEALLELQAMPLKKVPDFKGEENCINRPDFLNWTSEVRAEQEMAVLGCLECPVKDECLESAQKRKEDFGVWGGVIFAPATPAAEVLDLEDACKRGHKGAWVKNSQGKRRCNACQRERRKGKATEPVTQVLPDVA